MTDDSSSEQGAPPRPSTALVAGRVYGDSEISRILQTAAELQERSQALSAGAPRGLTLEELRQVALEAGIDPRFVDLAAADATGPVERKENVIAGGPYSWHFQQSVPGDIVDADREKILRALRSVMGQKGELEDVFGRMEWSHDDGLGPLIIGISSRDGVTDIDVSANRSSEVGLIMGLGIPMGGVLGGAVVASLMALSGPIVLAPIGAASVLSYALGRFGWRLRARHYEGKLRHLIERITSIAQEASLREPDEKPEGGDEGA